MPGLKKKSINLAGHATSVALEPEFWTVIETIAKERSLSISGLIGEFDRLRGESLLASYCRISALNYALNKSSLKRKSKAE